MIWMRRFLVLVLVLIVLAVGALFLLPTDRIVALATERFESASGRALIIEGDVRPSLWPTLGLSVNTVQIENSDWAGPSPMLEAERVSIGVDPTTLFGEVKITSIVIERPIIRLATDETGRKNWEFGKSGAAGPSDQSGGDTAASLPTLDGANVKDGTLIFQSANRPVVQLDNIDATAAFPDSTGPLELTVSGRIDAADFQLDGAIGEFANFVGGQMVPVDIGLSTSDANAAFSGAGGLAPLKLEGALSAEVSKVMALFEKLGLSASELPKGLGRDEVSLVSSAVLTDTNLMLNDLAATLDQNKVTGRASVEFKSARPSVNADLNLGAFDLSSVSTGGGTDTDAAGSTTGWSKDPINMSALGVIDGRISVRASSLQLGTASIDGLELETTVEDSRAVTEITTLRAYDGAAAGTLVLNARNGFSTRLDIAGSAFAISRLLAELVDYDRIVAAGDLQLNVLGVGNTMDALMNSLDGEGSFQVGAGELIGLDIVGMLRNLDTSFLGQNHTTIFDEITGTFRIVDGVVINDDLRLTAPLFRASGSGTIAIGKQTLNLSVIPELLGGDNAGIRVPLLVTGTWDNPKVRLDLETALKSRVEEEIRERVEEEIGDKIENKLEDKLKKGLGDLFNR